MKKIVVSLFLISFLSGCAHTPPLKAPCNWSGSNCHPRVKVNQWDSNQ